MLGLYENSSAEVAVRLADGLPLVLGDATQMRQIIHNLLRNAEDAQEDRDHAHIEIGTRVIGDRAELFVADAGPGFPPRSSPVSSRPYVTTKARGTGLGLAIVKKIVDEHHGNIDITNRPQGGAQVSIRLPLSPRQPEQVQSESGKWHILVVDDEIGIRELLSEIPADEGHSVWLAENATAARRIRGEKRPDLVLLDIWMPDTDGISLLKEWAANGQLTMPVVMMSGHGTIDTAVEATRIGAADFLEKPIALQKLLATVKKALKHEMAPVKAPLTLDAFTRSPLIRISRSASSRPPRRRPC